MAENLRAAIDIGSNSVLLLLIDVETSQEILNEARVTGLGRGIDREKKFSQQAQKDTFLALSDYRKLLQSKNFPIEKTIVTATEASRVAENAKEFFQSVQGQLGFKVSIISSQGEAFYSARGVSPSVETSCSEFVVMDIGGASTEFILVQREPFAVKTSISMPFGAVRMTEWSEERVSTQKLSLIEKEFSSHFSSFQNKPLICVAGTMTSLGNMSLGHKEFQEQDVSDMAIANEDLLSLQNKFQDLESSQLLDRFPFLGKRSKSILGGLTVAIKCFEFLQPANAIISTLGLRYGVALEGELKKEFIIS